MQDGSLKNTDGVFEIDALGPDGATKFLEQGKIFQGVSQASESRSECGQTLNTYILLNFFIGQLAAPSQNAASKIWRRNHVCWGSLILRCFTIQTNSWMAINVYHAGTRGRVASFCGSTSSAK